MLGLLDLLKELEDCLNNFYETVDIGSLTAKLSKFPIDSDSNLKFSIWDLWDNCKEIAKGEKTEDYFFANYYNFTNLLQQCKYNSYDEIGEPDIKKRVFVSPKENIEEMKTILSPTIKRMLDDSNNLKKKSNYQLK